MYKAVMFDLDGTLVYTNWNHRYNVVKKTIDALGGTLKTLHDINKFWFESGRSDFIQNSFNIEPKVFWREYIKHDIPELRMKSTKAFPDVGFVNELKQAGYKTGIVTGSPSHVAFAEIELLGKNSFDEIVIAHVTNGIMPKPHPQSLEKCMELLGVGKNESIYVGNSDEDILAAKNAGIFDVLLRRGEHEFPSLNSSAKINSLYELKDLLGFN